jgi:hypothetical protein
MDPDARRALTAAISDEPPRGAESRVWQSIALALPTSGVLLGATTTAHAATLGGTVGSSTTSVAALNATVATSTATAAGTASAAVGLGVLAGKAVALGLGIGLTVNAALILVPRAVAPQAPARVSSATVSTEPRLVKAELRRPQTTVTSPEETTVHTAAVASDRTVSRQRPAPAVFVARDLEPSPPPVPTTEPERLPISDELREESQLLVRARSALGAANGSRALELIAEHRAKYGTGMLGQERDALEVQTLLLLGRVTEARETARAFLVRFPVSPHSEKMRAIAATASP